jgi:hypothetical protein
MPKRARVRPLRQKSEASPRPLQNARSKIVWPAEAGLISPPQLSSVRVADVPRKRHGKHQAITTGILTSIEELDADSALRIPLAQIATSKANLRCAIHRAAKRQNVRITTASDETYFYVWRTHDGEGP